MANFRMKNGVGVSSVTGAPGMNAVVEIEGGGPDNKPLNAMEDNPSIAEVISEKPLPSAASLQFQLQFKAVGETWIRARVKTGSSAGSEWSSALKVRVVAPPSAPAPATTDLTVDLLRDKLGRSGNWEKFQTYHNIFDKDFDNADGNMADFHPYNQLGRRPNGQEKWPGVLACGDEMKEFGEKVLGSANLGFFAYHTLPQVTKMADYKYDPVNLPKAISKIKTLLNAGTAARIALLYHEPFSPGGKSYSPQHYVEIVGYRDNRFLYIDPYPGFSTAKYKLNGTEVTSRYLGYLFFDPSRNSFQETTDTTIQFGSRSIRVMAGPMF